MIAGNRFNPDRCVALALDDQDPLAVFRERFFVPEGRVYFDGNSLGLLARDGERALDRIINEWKQLGIEAWMGGAQPWFEQAERLGARMAALVGAKPEEVVASGGTTINLHALVSTFYQPSGVRTKILGDALTFPSDIYALQGQVKLRGLDPEGHLVLAGQSSISCMDTRTLDEAEIIDLMTDEIALAVLPAVLYRSGQLLDVERLSAAAHEHGIIIGFDCSHSAGVVPHEFDRWGVDFACWCSYKYLNGGPGCPAFLYVNERHFESEPGLPGWFGYKKAEQFELRNDFDHARGAGGWQISSPGVIGAAPIEGSLDIIEEAGIEAIRRKSLAMTKYLMDLVDDQLAEFGFEVVTPRESSRRGGHVALAHPKHARLLFERLTAAGIIGDFRPPDILRLSPSALYNTYAEIWQAVRGIKEIMETVGG